MVATNPSGRVVAVERDATRTARIGENAWRHGVASRLTVVDREARTVLAGLHGPPDAVFAGGGLDAEVFRARGRPWPGADLRRQRRRHPDAGTSHRAGPSMAAPAAHRARGGGAAGRSTAWRPALPVVQWAVREEADDGLLHRCRARRPDLITLRGAELLRRCPVCLYAGSLVPAEMLALCPSNAELVNTARMPLEEIVERMVAADTAGHDVARLHSGDPSPSAVAEQQRLLHQRGVETVIVPGVPAFAAAAASRTELTVPGVGQSLLITRVSTLSTDMPPGRRSPNWRRRG